METWQVEIRAALRAASIPKRLEYFRTIVPGAGEIVGTPMPVINELAKKYKSEGPGLASRLWPSEIFEERMLAAKILVAIAKKFPDEALGLTREFSGKLSDWAICDTIGMGVSKALMKKRRQDVLDLADEMLSCESFWQRRLGLVLLECFTRDPEMHPYIRQRIARVEHEKEHYIRKAVVWLNRAMTSALNRQHPIN